MGDKRYWLILMRYHDTKEGEAPRTNEEHETALWRFAMYTGEWRIVDQFIRGVTVGKKNLWIIPLGEPCRTS